jgi:DNA-binding response OmpR family regulator
VTLDPETGVVTYRDISVTLPVKPAAVLTALARRNGVPVQLSRLAVECWPERPASVSLQSVMTAVCTIRAITRKAGIPVEIANRRGSHVYSCAGVSIESATTVQLTKYQMEDLKQLVFSHRNKQLGARVWSAFGG